MSSFSNWGYESVDIAAPGSNIYTGSIIRENSFYDDFSDSDTSGWIFGAFSDNQSSFSLGFTDDNTLTDGSGFVIITPILKFGLKLLLFHLQLTELDYLGLT